MNTEKSFLKISKFNDKELLQDCVNYVNDKLEEYPKIQIYGKDCHQRRCIAFFSNESIGYLYSNKLLESQKLNEKLLLLLNKINEIFNSNYNGILINKYKDGNDYISAHSDNEKDLEKTNIISISFGSSRKFRIRDKNNKKIIKDFIINSYDMIVMGGNFQEEFTHEIPIEKKIKDERISFTFRKHNK